MWLGILQIFHIYCTLFSDVSSWLDIEQWPSLSCACQGCLTCASAENCHEHLVTSNRCPAAWRGPDAGGRPRRTGWRAGCYHGRHAESPAPRRPWPAGDPDSGPAGRAVGVAADDRAVAEESCGVCGDAGRLRRHAGTGRRRQPVRSRRCVAAVADRAAQDRQAGAGGPQPWRHTRLALCRRARAVDFGRGRGGRPANLSGHGAGRQQTAPGDGDADPRHDGGGDAGAVPGAGAGLHAADWRDRPATGRALRADERAATSRPRRSTWPRTLPPIFAPA